MQAYAIVGELQLPLNIYAQNEADMDNRVQRILCNDDR